MGWADWEYMKLITNKYKTDNGVDIIWKGVKVLGTNGREYFVGTGERASDMTEEKIEIKALKTIEDYKPKIKRILDEKC